MLKTLAEPTFAPLDGQLANVNFSGFFRLIGPKTRQCAMDGVSDRSSSALAATFPSFCPAI